MAQQITSKEIEELQAQSKAAQEQAKALKAASGSTQEVNSKGWSPAIAQTMGWSVLGFTVLALLIASALLWKRNIAAVQIVRLFLLVLIVAMTSFLVVVGYDDKQLTPVIGLFGAIAGYLLGRDSPAQPPPPAREEPTTRETSA